MHFTCEHRVILNHSLYLDWVLAREFVCVHLKILEAKNGVHTAFY